MLWLAAPSGGRDCVELVKVITAEGLDVLIDGGSWAGSE